MGIKTEDFVKNLPPKEVTEGIDWFGILDSFDPTVLDEKYINECARRNPYVTCYGWEKDGLAAEPIEGRLKSSYLTFAKRGFKACVDRINTEGLTPTTYKNARAALIKAIGEIGAEEYNRREYERLGEEGRRRQAEEYRKWCVNRELQREIEEKELEAGLFLYEDYEPVSMHEKVVKIRKGVLASNGKPLTQRDFANNRVLGYDEIDGVLTPNDKAWIPALILTRFAEGKRYEEIADELEEKNAERLRSKRKFNVSQFQSILKNEIYVGDRRIQKQPHVDYKTKKPKWGEEYESFYVEDDHEGIISREVWEKVQERLKREEEARKSGIYIRPNSHFLYGRILCGECGDPMIRRTEKGKDAQNVYWICRDRRKGKKGNGCKNLILLEEELLEVLAEALGVELECTDDANETDFESLKTLRIYEDGKIEIELNEEKETA